MGLSALPGTDNAVGLPAARAWYALHVGAQRERAVAAALGRLGVESFTPSYVEVVRWSDRVKKTERLLFPGYVFARLAVTSELADALRVSGVVSVLPSNLRPVAIADAEMTNLIHLIETQLPVSPAVPVAGDKISVKSGPLKGACGVVVRGLDGVRLVVSVDMLGRAVSCKIDAADVEHERVN